LPTPDLTARRTIYFLVTDPSEEWILTRFGDESTIALPRVEVDERSGGATLFADAVRSLLGGDVSIRQIVPLHPDSAASDWLVELEPTDRSRRGHRWIHRDEIDSPRIEPPKAQDLIGRWLRRHAEPRTRDDQPSDLQTPE
jgi:hypothetical protein